MIFFILFEFVQINVFKKDKNALLTGLISLLLLVFSLYLWIKNGLLLDHGTTNEIQNAHAELMFFSAITGLFISLFFISISILKYILWKIKGTGNKT